MISPHSALSSREHGPLPVKMKLSATGQENGDVAERDELLRPCFKATISIPPGDSRQLHAGQRATISFASTVETSGGRLARQIEDWIHDRLARVRKPSSGAG
jgi:hypothetical protein